MGCAVVRPRYTIEGLRWLEDEDGWYCVDDLLRDSFNLGVNGN